MISLKSNSFLSLKGFSKIFRHKGPSGYLNILGGEKRLYRFEEGPCRVCSVDWVDGVGEGLSDLNVALFSKEIDFEILHFVLIIFCIF